MANKKKDKYKKYLKSKKLEFIKNNYQYITIDVCNDYMKKAELVKGDLSKMWILKDELMNIYGILEIEAINILNGNEALSRLYVKGYNNVKEFNEMDFALDDIVKKEDMFEIDLNNDIVDQIANYTFLNDNYNFEEKD
jgi:hypothetical protein